MKTMGRPRTYTVDTVVRLSAGEHQLHSDSKRTAVITKLMDMGGTASLGDLEVALNDDVRLTAGALIRAGWLEVVE